VSNLELLHNDALCDFYRAPGIVGIVKTKRQGTQPTEFWSGNN
jgi:hypothetical protein